MMNIGQWRLRHTSMPQQLDSFCFITKENGNQQDICNLTTMLSVQRSLNLDGMTNNFSNMHIEVPKGVDGRIRDVLEQCKTICGKAAGIKTRRRSRARTEASAKGSKRILQTICWFKTPGIHILVWWWSFRSCWSEDRSNPRNCVIGRWVLTTKTDEQDNCLKAKARWVLRGFQDKHEEYKQTDSHASTRPGFRIS